MYISEQYIMSLNERGIQDKLNMIVSQKRKLNQQFEAIKLKRKRGKVSPSDFDAKKDSILKRIIKLTKDHKMVKDNLVGAT